MDKDFKHLVANMSKLIRTEQYKDKPHLVVPVIMSTIGVHNDVYYSEEEQSKFPDAWNGRPVCIYHPTENGIPISCNTPENLEKVTAGILFNTNWEDGKLKSEAWIDVEKADTIDPEVMKALKANKVLEVSTGLWFDMDNTSGTWNNEQYKGIALNIRPDHLAILPKETGACSVADGAGMPRINQQEKPKSKFTTLINSVKNVFGIKAKDKSHNQVYKQLADKLYAQDTGINKSTWIVDVYDKYVIYEYNMKLYKQKYKSTRDNVELVDNAVEVELEQKYVPIQINGEKEMNKEEMIDALIANKATKWTQDDKETLTESFNEDILTKMVPNEPTQPELPKVTPEVDESPAVNEQEEVTVESFIVNAPKAIQEVLTAGLALQKENKGRLIKGIIANKRNKFTAGQLEAKDTAELELIANLAEVKKDFSGQVGTVATNKENSLPTMPKLFPKKDK